MLVCSRTDYLALICVLALSFNVPLIHSAPINSLYDKFLEFLEIHQCKFPEKIITPTQTNDLEDILKPINICKTHDSIDANKPVFMLCDEIFAVLTNITCNFNNIKEEINVPLSTNVCEDLIKKQDLILNKNSIAKKLSDKFTCAVTCENYENACKLLLWEYEVQSKIADILHTHPISDNNIDQTPLSEPNNPQIKPTDQNISENEKEQNGVELSEQNFGDEQNYVDNESIQKNKKDEKNSQDIASQDQEKPKQNPVNPEAIKLSTIEPSRQETLVEHPHVESKNPPDVEADSSPNIPSDKDANLNSVIDSLTTKLKSSSIVLPTANTPNISKSTNDLNVKTNQDNTDDSQNKILNGNSSEKNKNNQEIKNVHLDNDNKASPTFVLSSILTNNKTTVKKISVSNQNEMQNANNSNKKETLSKEDENKKQTKSEPIEANKNEEITNNNENKHEIKPNSNNEDNAKITTSSSTTTENEIKPTSSAENKIELGLISDTENKKEVSSNSDIENHNEIKPDANVENKSETKPSSDIENTDEIKPEAEETNKNEAKQELGEANTNTMGNENQLPIEQDQYNIENMEGEYPRLDYGQAVKNDQDAKVSADNTVSKTYPQNPQKNTIGRGNDEIPVIPSFPDQEEGHFFFYFVSIVVVLMVGYLIIHNKQKIIALIVEGRHERRRRSHGVGYKKLETK